MSKKITEKLKDVLSPEDLAELEEGIKKMVKEQVDEKVKLLGEEKTSELEKKAEEFCEQEIEKKVAEEKEQLIEEYEKKMVDLETNMVDKLDKFLDSVISEQISDEAIAKIAINETYSPIVEGIKKLFEEKYVALDSEGDKLVKEVKKELEALKEENSRLLAEKMEADELAEKGAIRAILAEKTDGLTETQKERVNTFCEGKSFEDIESTIDSFIEIVEEEKEEDKEDLKENADPNLSDEDADDNLKEKKDLKEGKEEDKEEDKKEVSPLINSAQKYF